MTDVQPKRQVDIKAKVESFVGAVKSDVVKGAGKGNKKGDKGKQWGVPGGSLGEEQERKHNPGCKGQQKGFSMEEWKKDGQEKPGITAVGTTS